MGAALLLHRLFILYNTIMQCYYICILCYDYHDEVANYCSNTDYAVCYLELSDSYDYNQLS